MGIFTQNAEEKIAEAPVEPAVEAQPEAIIAPEKNCSGCSGSGLIFNNGTKKDELCATCNGTGIVDIKSLEFKPGTQIIRPDGTFIVSETGELVQQ